MKQDQSFHDHVVGDLLARVPGVSSRAMFGGWGLYQEGVIFGLIADGELFFKTDDTNRAAFEHLGSRPFVYAKDDGKPATMSYWLVPESILEDRAQLSAWVERSAQISRRARTTKRTKVRPAKRAAVAKSR